MGLADEALLKSATDSLGDDNKYLAQDPYFMAGNAVMGVKQPQWQGNSGAILGPILQGLTGGFLKGYGTQDAMQNQYTDYKNSPIMQALAAPQPGQANFMGPLPEGQTPGDVATDPLHAYSSDTVPNGWTPAMGKQDLIMAAIIKSEQQAEAEKKQALQDQIALLTNKDVIAAKIQEAQGAKTEKEIPGAETAKIATGVAIDHQFQELKAIAKTMADDSSLIPGTDSTIGAMQREARSKVVGTPENDYMQKLLDIQDAGAKLFSGSARMAIIQARIDQLKPGNWGSLDGLLHLIDNTRNFAADETATTASTFGNAGYKKLQDAQQIYDNSRNSALDAILSGAPNTSSGAGFQAPPQTKTIGNVTYTKVPGGWQAN